MAARRPQLHALTGLRFLAALHVTAYHLYYEVFGGQGAPALLHGVLASGYVGVSLFFVLSGFILAYNYLDEPFATAEARSRFWSARFARVYPVYALGLVLSLPFVLRWTTNRLGQGEVATEQLASLVLAPLLLQAWTPWTAIVWNSPGWSLSVEAFFYALFPALSPRIAALRGAALRRLALGACALALLPPALYWLVDPDGLGSSAGPYHSGTWLQLIRFHPLARVPEFLLGITTAALLREHPRSGAAAARWAGAATVLVLAVLTQSDRLPFPLLHNGLLAPAFALLIYGLAQSNGPFARALGSPPAILLGEASYALYLLQVPILLWVHRGARAFGIELGWEVACAQLVLLLGTSMWVFRWVEEPARRWLRARLGGGATLVRAEP